MEGTSDVDGALYTPRMMSRIAIKCPESSIVYVKLSPNHTLIPSYYLSIISYGNPRHRREGGGFMVHDCDELLTNLFT